MSPDPNNASVIDDGNSGSDHSLAPEMYRSNERLIRSLAFFRNHPTIKKLLSEWRNKCQEYRQRYVCELSLDNDQANEVPQIANVRGGPFACGPVIKNKKFKKKILEINRQMLAIETESGGVFEVLESSLKKENVIVLRGICDHADSDKTKLEKTTKGLARKCAAINVSLYLFFQLKSRPFVRAVKELQNPGLPLSRDLKPPQSSTDILEDRIQELSDEIDERLNELSPEYRLKPKGYVLPAPRFTQIPFSSGDIGSDFHRAENIAHIISQNQVAWIKLDTTYPDDRLPWVLAQHLIRQEANNSFILPTVFEGNQIRKPKGTIKHLLKRFKPENLEDEHACQTLVIIHNPNLTTENARTFLTSQITQNPNVKFILISRDHFRLTDINSSFKTAGGRVYAVDKVSFLELANFLQKAFKMDSQKAEVLAIRLDQIFSRFELLAHPTYFAGIPESILIAFLQANRRSELIQLAVDGFLTFLVADDQSDVTLSRTTRQLFLRRLVYRLKVELQHLNKMQLVQMAGDFADTMDYEIDAAGFVDDFFRKGILRDNEGATEFALPFFEIYLLALELKDRDAKDQERYFNIGQEHVDFATLDLFCEICEKNSLIPKILHGIDTSINNLEKMYPDDHIVFTSSVRPRILLKPEIIGNLVKSIGDAEKDVQEGKSRAAEKQAKLDLVNEGIKVAEDKKLRAAETDEQNYIEIGDKDEKQFAKKVKKSATFHFQLGSLVIGAGAERLNAQRKQELISRLLKLGALIADGWTRDRLEIINAKDIENDLRASTGHVRAVSGFNTKEEVSSFNRFVRRLSEVLEFRMLQEPTEFVLQTLSELGRHKVLAQSIQSVNVSNGFEEILQGLWLTDVKTDAGLKSLGRTVKEYNPDDFFRLLFVEHFLRGVHWDHWKKSDRLKLIQFSTFLLKPTRLKLAASHLAGAVPRKKNVPRKKKTRRPRSKSR